MALNGIVQRAPAGMHGFDCDSVVGLEAAQRLRASGFSFCIRYISRGSGQEIGDLSRIEAAQILEAGLALMAVQHVAPSGWVPTAELGTVTGRNAAGNADEIGLLPGMSLWVDLEEILNSTPAEDVIAYCNAWADAVTTAGYVPGVYVGANCILSGDDLFWRLKVKHYWKSGSLVPEIPLRGYQMVQRIVAGDVVAGIEIDRNLTMTDQLGGSVLWLAPGPADAPIA